MKVSQHDIISCCFGMGGFSRLNTSYSIIDKITWILKKKTNCLNKLLRMLQFSDVNCLCASVAD